MRTILSAPAWPYANGPRHIGHVAGFGVPSDVFSRYHRMAGDERRPDERVLVEQQRGRELLQPLVLVVITFFLAGAVSKSLYLKRFIIDPMSAHHASSQSRMH